MPAYALERLLDGYRNGDPKLIAFFKEFRVVGMHSYDELALAVWEDEGGQ